MAKKKEITNNISLFDDNDVKTINKNQTKTKQDKNANNVNNSNGRKSSSKLLDNDKRKKDNAKNGVAKSKKVGTDDIRKQSDVKKHISEDGGKTTRGRKKTDSGTTKTDDKSTKPTKSTKSRKSKETKDNKIQVIEPVKEKKKVGPKKWKYGYYKGFEDELVWLDEVGHWVSKSAFTQTDSKHPKYEYANYVQGLDSYYVMFIYKPKEKDNSHIYENLKIANKKLKTKYKTWDELSEHQVLNEDFVTEYKDYINWTKFAFANKNREFSKAFKKKFREKFLILVTAP